MKRTRNRFGSPSHLAGLAESAGAAGPARGSLAALPVPLLFLLLLLLLLLLLPLPALHGLGRQERPDRSSPARITLMMGTWWEDALPRITARFHAENPGMAVSVRTAAYDGYTETLLSWSGAGSAAGSAAAHGDPPDVAAVASPDMLSLLAARGLLSDLAPLAGRSAGVGGAGFMPGAWRANELRGALYAVPYRVSTFALHYNRSHFREAGLDPDGPPESHEELLEAARKLTVPGRRSGFSIPGRRENDAHLAHSLALPVWASGGGFLSADARDPRIAEPESVRGMQWWIDLYSKHRVVPERAPEYDQSDNSRLFGEQAVSMVYAGLWAGDVIGRAAAARGDATGPDYAVAMIPPDKVSTVRTWGLAVLTRTRRREAAWRFVEWFCDPAALPDRAIRPPASLSGLTRVPWSSPAVLPFMSTALYARPFAPVSRWRAVQAAIAGEVHQALLGGKTAQEAADAAEARIRALLEGVSGDGR